MPTSSKTGRILIVDDNEINLKLVNLLLSEKGASVTEANDGLQAIHMATDQSFDLILMDVHMPIIKGTDACRQIRMTNNSNQDVPIVALTADAVPKTRHEIIEAGMDGYLLKPVEKSQLWNLILPLLDNNTADSHRVDSIKQEIIAENKQCLPIRDSNQLLVATGGDRMIANTMFEKFCHELPEELVTIRRHFNNSQLEPLWETVHRLYGASSICGVPALNAAVKELETACRKQQINQIEIMLVKLETEAENLLNTK